MWSRRHYDSQAVLLARAFIGMVQGFIMHFGQRGAYGTRWENCIIVEGSLSLYRSRRLALHSCRQRGQQGGFQLLASIIFYQLHSTRTEGDPHTCCIRSTMNSLSFTLSSEYPFISNLPTISPTSRCCSSYLFKSSALAVLLFFVIHSGNL